MVDGVEAFEHFYAIIEACFPAGKARCINCNYYLDKSRRCGLTMEVCVEPEKYRHWDCPLIPKEEENEREGVI